MSEYTCLMLSTTYDEVGIGKVNEQLSKWGCGDRLARIDTRAGPMPLGTALWAVAVRRAGRDQILDALGKIQWSVPPVQALIKPLYSVGWEAYWVAPAGAPPIGDWGPSAPVGP